MAERGDVRAEAEGREEAGRVEGKPDYEVERKARRAFVGAAGEVDKREWERCLRRNAGRHGETRAVRFASQWWNAGKGKEKIK